MISLDLAFPRFLMLTTTNINIKLVSEGDVCGEANMSSTLVSSAEEVACVPLNPPLAFLLIWFIT